MADHQPFALLLLRQIVGAHRALRQAESGPEGERERSVQIARQRLNQLIQQAAVQFPTMPDAAPAREPPTAAPIARH